MANPKDFEIYKHIDHRAKKLNAVSLELYLAEKGKMSLSAYHPHTRQCKELKNQLLAKYPLKSTVYVGSRASHYLIAVGNHKTIIPPTDLVLVQQIETDLEEHGGEHFLPIVTKSKTLCDRAALRAINWHYRSTPAAILRELRYLPSVVVGKFYSDRSGYQTPIDHVLEFLELTMQRLFEDNFNWDYMESNDKLTDDEHKDLRHYIRRQLIDLKVFKDFDVILGDLTDEEKVDEKADLKKAVKALKKA